MCAKARCAGRNGRSGGRVARARLAPPTAEVAVMGADAGLLPAFEGGPVSFLSPCVLPLVPSSPSRSSPAPRSIA